MYYCYISKKLLFLLFFLLKVHFTKISHKLRLFDFLTFDRSVQINYNEIKLKVIFNLHNYNCLKERKMENE